ncbi:cytochrome c [Meinhardsimonia xiamenensis]|jgi:cytochrome c|uniref:Cytochrome c n=1 Tax=Meinhardsimonia xiamenensis TaxID=990712 RepID=A0A1G9CFQ0_9RHOB|nr:cytochrome c family protein [Meinhardsimonia xiamenensis]PRX38379.1 cytochrome c [Meinhardsimonia xiamenensis]SDK50416.1 cytochrome c [Meinhardsimonia xiamenensis]
MIDTMTGTKIVGGFCGSLLVFLLINWASEGLYHRGSGHGYEEGHAVQGYVIDTGEEEGGKTEVAEEAGPDFAEVYASADPAKGEAVFRACKACHKLEPGANATGPTLYGVVGRAVDSVEGYAYSGALRKVADVWTPENLDKFLADPKGFAPGTKMNFKGIKKIEDRANLIAYLAQHGG